MGWRKLAEASRVVWPEGHDQPWQGPDQTEEVVCILGEQSPGRVRVAVVDGVASVGRAAAAYRSSSIHLLLSRHVSFLVPKVGVCVRVSLVRRLVAYFKARGLGTAGLLPTLLSARRSRWIVLRTESLHCSHGLG